MADPTPSSRFSARDDFAGLAAARSRLDEHELELIDRARASGATWAEVAALLGLGSRQAAEQRRRRLADNTSRRRSEQDERYGLSAVRAAVADLLAAVEADPHWAGRFPRAALVRSTLDTAREAGAGSLFALSAQAAADLDAARPGRLPAPLRAALADFRLLLRAAGPRSHPSQASSTVC